MGGAATTMSLSVCCITRGPTQRVAAQLQPLRELASEIVIAVDDRVDTRLLVPLAELADDLVLYPYLDPVDRPVGWVHSLCTQDWILWLDDDELPGTELLRELPKLLAAAEETHYWLPRRWLYGSPRTYLAGAPWEPDLQLRLVQNDPRLLWFPGVTHRPIEAVGPHRFLPWPILHSDLLLNPLEARRQKARRYETVAPGRRLAGLPMNLALYLPELRDELDVRPLPPEDAALVDAALATTDWPEPADTPSFRHASREEVDAHWHGREPDEALYRAELELVDRLATLALREERGIRLRVRNRGTRLWPWDRLGVPEVRVSYRWWTPAGELEVGDGLRTPFPHAVPPGEQAIVLVDVAAPPRPGLWVLELDLVHEHVRWFGCSLRIPVEVTPLRKIGLVGGDEQRLRAVATVAADLLPGVEPLVLAPDAGGAAERTGYEAAPDASEYVLHAGPGRARTALRAIGLVAAAGARRAGVQPPVARVPLDALATVDALLDLGRDGSPRERLAHRALVLAAKGLGLPVVVVGWDAEAAVRTAGGLLGERVA